MEKEFREVRVLGKECFFNDRRTMKGEIIKLDAYPGVRKPDITDRKKDCTVGIFQQYSENWMEWVHEEDHEEWAKWKIIEDNKKLAKKKAAEAGPSIESTLLDEIAELKKQIENKDNLIDEKAKKPKPKGRGKTKRKSKLKEPKDEDSSEEAKEANSNDEVVI